MHTLIIKAYRDLTRRRLRSALTLLGILIGVAGVVAIVTTAQALAEAQAEAYNNASQSDIWCWTWNVPRTIRRPLEALPNVAAVELCTSYYTRWRVPARYEPGATAWRSVRIIGLHDFEHVQVNQVRLHQGNWPGPGEVLVERSSLDTNPVRIGDTITIKTRQGRGERTLTVSGIAWTPAYPSAAILAYSLCYAPVRDVQEFAGLTGDNMILIRLTDVGQRDKTAERIAQTLHRRNVWFDHLHVRDPGEFVGKRELEAIFAVMTLFTALGLLISGFLVANTLSAIVSEQVSEIGAIKAVGGTRQQVLALYLVASALYGLVGTAMGSVVGFLGSDALIDYIAGFLTLDVGLPVVPRAFGLGAVVGLGVTVAAGFWPAWRGTGISVREALSAYGIVSAYGQGTIDRLLTRLRGLPPLVLFSARNLARRKSRSLITFLAIGVATAAFLAAQATSASVEGAIDTLFHVYNSDAWVWFEEPVRADFAARLRAIPGVTGVERWSNVGCNVQYTQALLYGLPADTRMYRYDLAAGRWFAPGAWDEIVLTTGLAEKASVHPGDSVTLDIWGNQREFQVVGLAVDNITSGIGATPIGKAFAPADTVSRLMGRQGWADFFALQTQDRSPAGVEAVLTRIEDRYGDLKLRAAAAYADMEYARDVSRILTLALWAMVVIVALSGGIGVLNTLALNVMERRREIGVLRAIGAVDWSMVQVFLTEGLILGLLGAIVGLLIAYPLARYFVDTIAAHMGFPIPTVFTGGTAAAGALFALILAAAASLGPALGAARMRVSEALRYE